MIPVTEFSQEISDILSSEDDREVLKLVARRCIDCFTKFGFGGYSGAEVVSSLCTFLQDPNDIVSSSQIKSVRDRLDSKSVPDGLANNFAYAMQKMQIRLLKAAREDSRFDGPNEAYIDVSGIKQYLLENHSKLFLSLDETRQDAMCWQGALEWVRAVSQAREDIWYAV